MPSFPRHVFVCINERPADAPRGCCKSKGGVEVRDALKVALGKRGLGKVVRANNAGCLDQCEHGVTMVVYPEQVWYGHVTEADVDEIVEKHIIGGQFVERLMLPEQPHLNGATSGPALVVAPAKPKAEKASDPA
jgi:(2Fe-2S) ferredoxin